MRGKRKMHDTNNLKKRLTEYRKLYNVALIAHKYSEANSLEHEISDLEKRIELRKRNQVKNKKAYKKAHGYFA